LQFCAKEFSRPEDVLEELDAQNNRQKVKSESDPDDVTKEDKSELHRDPTTGLWDPTTGQTTPLLQVDEGEEPLECPGPPGGV
jgi:hypothetical protein